MVIGLSFFVSMSTVYGTGSLYASASGGKEISNKIVSAKVNPYTIANIAYSTNAPVEIKDDVLQNNSHSVTPSLSFAGNGVVDASYNDISKDSKTRKDIIKHTVLGGETLWTIAKKFNVTTNTIKWANGMSDADSIKPGQVLKIPPVTGVVHKVKSGEQLVKIAEKYNASIPQIIEENGLVDKEIEDGQVLIIPGGRVWEPAPQPAPQPTTRLASSRSYSTSGRTVAYGGRGNKFPYGWCTYYVASRRTVTWRGNAGAWLSNARAQGYATGYSPRAGAIIVTNESPVGHVGIVESVSGGSIRISEMNYRGWGVVSSRTIPASSGVIRGYIY